MRKLKLTGKERFLVVRTDRIGDVVLSTPVLEVIKSGFPQAHVAVMVSRYAADVLKHNPYLDDVIIDDTEDRHKGINGFFDLVKEVRKKGFDIGILLRPTLLSALLLFLSGIRYRIGTGFRLYQILLNRKVYVHRKVNLRHEAEYNLDLLGPLEIPKWKVLPKMYVTPEEENFAYQIFNEFEIAPGDVAVVVHPGSGNSSLNLPPRRFAEAADMLIEKFRARIIFTGSEQEKELIDLVKRSMHHESLDLAGRTTLRQLAAILKKADVVISNSTGPMHVASSLGTPTVAIFCPIFAASPIRWGPYGEGHQIILPPVPVCFKCKPVSCPHYNCMDKIKAEQIVSKVEAVLKNKPDIAQTKRP
ncbi:MAG: glycosyltransferase family 9 protein [Candidatus Zixiibacteriota bacterium]